MKRGKKYDSSSYGGCKLFLSKDWFEVMGVDCSIANILSFRIDVPLSSKSIRFDTKMTRIEPDNKIELRKIFRPLYLPLDQHLGSGKVLKVFVICDNINEIS